jgi:acetyltransferase-like isoleucine patch superfamily enzyme
MSKRSVAQKLGTGINRFRTLSSWLWQLEARFKGVTFQGRVKFYGRPIISVAPGSTMILGDEIGVASAPRSTLLGCFQPTVLRTLAGGAELIMEKGSGVSGTVICAAKRIEIGEGTIAGAGAMIIDSDFHAQDETRGWVDAFEATARPIQIGKHVFIGARAIILKGVTIGDESVVGAGAVVTRGVPAGHMAVGNPARILPRK